MDQILSGVIWKKSMHFLKTLPVPRNVRMLWPPLFWWLGLIWPLSHSTQMASHTYGSHLPTHLSFPLLFLDVRCRETPCPISSPPTLIPWWSHPVHALKHCPHADVVGSYVCCNKLTHVWWFKTTESSFSQFWSPEIKVSITGLKSSCCQGSVPSGGSRGESIHCLFQLLGLPAFLCLWMPPSNLCFPSHTASSSSVCVGNLPLPLL